LLGIGTSGLVKGYSEGAAGLVAAERYYNLLAYDDDDDIANGECTTKVDDAAAAVRGQELEKPQNVQSLNVQDLHFYYKGSPHRPCLNGVSFELRRGEVVALVGANGSGKTTMASLLCGLFAPTKGAIYVCDPTTGAQTALCDLNRSSKQRLVQMIPQSAALFDISIVENVRYGNPTASLLDVRYALSKAKCNDFISRLPNGLDSRIGVGGRSLSGGECQRLALARALLADPPILIMDEPTNSLDAEGMAAISEAVSSGQGRAMLLITHHAKTLELADRVLVMDHGTIVEQGTLSELRGNRNSKLCELMPSLVKVQ
jgi:ABC-type multidrug transport system fused ATPase/permease subunit